MNREYNVAFIFLTFPLKRVAIVSDLVEARHFHLLYKQLSIDHLRLRHHFHHKLKLLDCLTVVMDNCDCVNFSSSVDEEVE